MLTIRKEQQSLFDESSERQFEARLINELGVQFFEQFAGAAARDDFDDTFRNWVRVQFDQAEARGIAFEGDYAVYVALVLDNTLVNARPMDDQDDVPSWAKPLLDSDKAAGDMKMALVENSLHVRAETDERYEKLLDVLEALRAEFG